VKKGDPLCLIGDSGTGKSHLLIALGTEAAMASYRVKYTLATKLVNELVKAANEMILAKTIARYGRVDLICIDELGYMGLNRRGAELLFQVLTEREEKNSVAIASNESFGKAGPKPSPTPACAPQSSIASPSAATSSKPAPTPTASPTPAPPNRRKCPLMRGDYRANPKFTEVRAGRDVVVFVDSPPCLRIRIIVSHWPVAMLREWPRGRSNQRSTS
jgi:hypothetical protein